MKVSKAAGIAIAGALVIGMIAGAGLLYANRDAFFKAAAPEPAAKSELARFAVGSLTRLETPAAIPMAPAYVFKTREGADTTFARFRGKVVVVNLWAMWCAPCRMRCRPNGCIMLGFLRVHAAWAKPPCHAFWPSR